VSMDPNETVPTRERPVAAAGVGYDWGPARSSVFAELRKNQSVLRSETAVTLSRLRLSFPSPTSILDAGGPTGNIWKAMSIDGHRTLSLNLSRDRAPDVVGDLDSAWPFRSESFDLIVSHYVLEHLREPGCFFRESFRCLKPEGLLVLTTVLLFQRHGSPNDYFRFTKDGLLSLSRAQGYEAETRPMLAGPLQATASILSPFLLHSWIRIGVLLSARAVDACLGRLLSFVGENWCSGYVLLARKAGKAPSGAR
jgi:SAM-dependent methyltransferase